MVEAEDMAVVEEMGVEAAVTVVVVVEVEEVEEETGMVEEAFQVLEYQMVWYT